MYWDITTEKNACCYTHQKPYSSLLSQNSSSIPSAEWKKREMSKKEYQFQVYGTILKSGSKGQSCSTLVPIIPWILWNIFNHKASQSFTLPLPAPPPQCLGEFWSVWCVYNKSMTAQLNYSKQHKEYGGNMQNSAYMIYRKSWSTFTYPMFSLTLLIIQTLEQWVLRLIHTKLNIIF